MRKPIVLALAFMLMLGTVYAGGPGSPRPGANTPAPTPAPSPAPNPSPAPAPSPSQEHHGKKNGWNKNTHNPHNAHCDNPGHAKQQVK